MVSRRSGSYLFTMASWRARRRWRWRWTRKKRGRTEDDVADEAEWKQAGALTGFFSRGES